MRSLRAAAINRGWIRESETLLAPRLAFPLAGELPDVVHDANRHVRDAVLEDVLRGPGEPINNPSFFGSEQEAVVAETDRFGIPLRTVLGTKTGLMRSDPYYSEAYLAQFYNERYRDLYRPKRFSLSWFLSEQIRAGQRILERVASHLPTRANVLDIGCGMGGNLIAFRFAGHDVHGCDYGDAYAGRGRELGLDIRTGGVDAVQAAGPFDLIILSHVIEHVTQPIDLMTHVASLLKPGGICFIEVPGLMNLQQWYAGDILEYLQNAHRWHFTQATLEAVLHRSGLRVREADQTVRCIASLGEPISHALPLDGPSVLAEINRLESLRAGTN